MGGHGRGGEIRGAMIWEGRGGEGGKRREREGKGVKRRQGEER